MDQLALLSSTTLWSLLAGLLPAIFWLWFWLKEDPHPEPRGVLTKVFFAGVMAVPVALFLEKIVYSGFINMGWVASGAFSFSVILAWAMIEEIVKYLAVKFTALRMSAFDEPIDAPIYLITAAIGFAALENVFFLFRTFLNRPELWLLTGEMRFLGATLLHVVASAIVGVSIAFSFFHKENKARNVFWGLVLATLLHTLFNLFIINYGDDAILSVFTFVWIVGVVLFFFLEKIKKIKEA